MQFWSPQCKVMIAPGRCRGDSPGCGLGQSISITRRGFICVPYRRGEADYTNLREKLIIQTYVGHRQERLWEIFPLDTSFSN